MIYRTPENFSNMIMNSDGEYLTGWSNRYNELYWIWKGGNMQRYIKIIAKKRGIKNKIELLRLEGNDMSKYYVQKWW